MRIVIDSAAHSVILREVESEHTFSPYSKLAFDVLSLQWIPRSRLGSEIVKERELYSRLVTPGSYILAPDGALEASENNDTPESVSHWPAGWLERLV